MSTDQPTPDQAYRFCRNVTRRRARNFYYGLKLTPQPQRSALYAVYAWMRRADDLVDNAPEITDDLRRDIAAFRATTDAALSGRVTVDEHLWVALADTATRFDLPREAFHLTLEGQLDDLAGAQYATFSDMRDYCYRVASTVGQICIGIWGYSDPAARDLAVDRGIAFQMTNILRDYREDFDVGRVYLPTEDFERHGITPQDLRRWSDPSACTALITRQVERANSYYQRSAPLDGMISRSGRPTLWAMTAIYHALLAKIGRSPHRIADSRRLRLSSLRKGSIALRARWLNGRGSVTPAAVTEA